MTSNPPQTYHLRLLHKSDLPVLKKIIEPHISEQFFWSAQALEAELLRAHLAVGLYQSVDSELQSFVIVQDVSAAYELTVLATLKEVQGQGWMKKLLSNVISRLGLTKEIWLEVHEHNLPAIKLYKTLGFQQVALRKNYYSDGGTALLLSLKST